MCRLGLLQVHAVAHKKPTGQEGPLPADWTCLVKKNLPKIFIVLYCGCFYVLDSTHNVFISVVKGPEQMES